MSIANKIALKELKVANTSNVKEMKDGRPQTVMFTKEQAKDLPNCTIVTLGATMQSTAPELDHVHAVSELDAEAEAEAVAAGTAYVVVAPEIMVEETRRTDGHIGLFRLEADETYTAYKLQKHDRLELSANHDFVTAGTVISTRKMAEPLIIAPVKNQMYDAAQIEMKKIEF